MIYATANYSNSQLVFQDTKEFKQTIRKTYFKGSTKWDVATLVYDPRVKVES